MHGQSNWLGTTTEVMWMNIVCKLCSIGISDWERSYLLFLYFQVKCTLQSNSIIFKREDHRLYKGLKMLLHYHHSQVGLLTWTQGNPTASFFPFRLTLTSLGFADLNAATRKIWAHNSKPVKSGLQSKPIIFSDTSYYRWFYLNMYSCNWPLVPFPKASV